METTAVKRIDAMEVFISIEMKYIKMKLEEEF